MVNVNTLHKRSERSEAKRMFDDGTGQKQVHHEQRVQDYTGCPTAFASPAKTVGHTITAVAVVSTSVVQLHREAE